MKEIKFNSSQEIGLEKINFQLLGKCVTFVKKRTSLKRQLEMEILEARIVKLRSKGFISYELGKLLITMAYNDSLKLKRADVTSYLRQCVAIFQVKVDQTKSDFLFGRLRKINNQHVA